MDEKVVLPDEPVLRARLEGATGVNNHLVEKVIPELVFKLQGEHKQPFGVVNVVVLAIEQYRLGMGLSAGFQSGLMLNVAPLLWAIAGDDAEQRQLVAAWDQVQQSR